MLPPVNQWYASWYDTWVGDSVTFEDDVSLLFGTSQDAAIEWNTAQTADALMVAVSGSNNIIIGTLANIITNNYDLALGNSTYPQLVITSNAAWTTAGNKAQRGRMYHDGSNFNIVADTGSVVVNDELIVTTNIIPDASNTDDIGNTTYEFRAIYLGSGANSGAYIGVGQEARLYYDSGFFTSTTLLASNAAGPAFVNEAATSTNPTLCPDRAELDTGIGWASDTLHFVLGGTSYANISTTLLTLAGDIELTSGGTVQTDSGDITLDSAGGLVFDMTTVSSFSWAGTALLKLDDAAVSEFAATAAAGTSTYFRAQSGADNASGTGYAGASGYFKAGDAGDATAGDNDGGDGGDWVFEPGLKGALSGGGANGADGKFIVRQPGGIAGTDEGQIYHDGTYLWIEHPANTGIVLRQGVNNMQWNGGALFAAANAADIGNVSGEWRGGFFGEDTTTGPVGTSGLYLGKAQEVRLRYNKDATGYPANCLILGLESSGTAAKDVLAFSEATVSGFTAANNTAGKASCLATQNAGTVTSGAGLAGATLTIETGVGSDAFAASGLDGGAGGSLAVTLGTGGAGDGGGANGAQGTMTVNGPVSITPATAVAGITVTQANNAIAFLVDSASTTYSALQVQSKFGGYFLQDISGGRAAYFTRDLNEAGTWPLVSIIDDHVSVTQHAFSVRTDSSTATTAAAQLLRNGITTTSTDGLLLENSTAATSGLTVQMSPRVRWRGHAMRTGAGEAAQTHDWIAEVLPATAAGADTSSTWQIGRSINGGAYAYVLQMIGPVLYVPDQIRTGTLRTVSGSLTLQNVAFSAADSMIEACTGTISNTTGEVVALDLCPTINQASGDGSWVGLLMDVTTTAVGSNGGQFMVCKDDSASIWAMSALGTTTWHASEDSVAVADQVSIGGYEIGAGNRVLAISQETAVTATGDIASTHGLQVRINGATYKILLSNA